jgi:hypothetical protein
LLSILYAAVARLTRNKVGPGDRRAIGARRDSSALPGRASGLPLPNAEWRASMLDMILVAGGVGFFVLAVFYVLACERM